jgi:hypothetical protein
MDFTHFGKDPYHDNIWYFGYELPDDSPTTIDFGDGTEVPIFPPRGQVTHQYDKAGKYTAAIKRGGKRGATTTVNARPGHSEDHK